MVKAATLLVPEQIIFDDEIYHTHRILAEGIDASADSLALDVIADVGPRGHFLTQEHTRQHVREIWIPELTHPRLPWGGQPLPARTSVIDQSFSQEILPEPSSLLAFTLFGTALASARRRSPGRDRGELGSPP